jgi:cystathionine beta-lyase/cystathionine gamma-synthase
MRGYGGIISVEFNLSLDKVKTMISSYKVFTLAESLGGVESLVCHPASMTHASIPPIERQKCGITDGLIRYSVGIEDTDDLVEDILSGVNQQMN